MIVTLSNDSRYIVHFKHYEVAEDNEEKMPNGDDLFWGTDTCMVTECNVFVPPCDKVPEKVLIATGKSYCNYLDNFNKKVGRKNAFSRAVKELTIGKSDRTEFWDAFLEQTKI
jgi:hypothetical protein